MTARVAGMALWFVLGLGGGIVATSDCRVAILAGAGAIGTALWVGLR